MKLLKLFFAFSILFYLNCNLLVSNELKIAPNGNDIYEGKEFYFTFHPSWEESYNSENKIMIFITSKKLANISLEIPNKNIKIEKVCLANNTVSFELSSLIAQCYVKSSNDAPINEMEFDGCGIIIKSDVPIICYGLNKSKITSEGFYIAPKTVLGKKYIVTSYNSPVPEYTGQYLTSYTSIVGVYPNTSVSIIVGGSKNNYTKKPNKLFTGSEKKITLQQGDVFLLGMLGDYNDLTGTIIEADKPIAVISGSYATNVPSQVQGAGYLIEQELPINSWGTTFHILPIKDKKKGSIVRIVASKDNTKVFSNGVEIGNIATSGGVTGESFLEYRIPSDNISVKPIEITAENPIKVVQFCTGFYDDSIPSAPFQLTINPVEQYKNEIYWTIPNELGQIIYKKNYLNVSFSTKVKDQIPDDIMFGQSNGSNIIWSKFKDLVKDLQLVKDDILANGQFWYSTTISLPQPTFQYALKSENKISAYCYGVDDYGVYAYPANMNFNDLSAKDFQKPKIAFTVDCEGNIQAKISDEGTNNNLPSSKIKTINIDINNSYNIAGVDTLFNKFIGSTYETYDFILKTISNKSPSKATIYVSDCAGNDTNFVIEYYPLKIGPADEFRNFGLFGKDDSDKKIKLTICNYSAKPIIIDSVMLYSSKNKKIISGFEINKNIYKENGGLLPEYEIGPGKILEFEVTFSPALVREDYEKTNDFLKYYFDSVYVTARHSFNDTTHCFRGYFRAIEAMIGVVDTFPPKYEFEFTNCGNSAKGRTWDEVINGGASNIAFFGIDNEKSFNIGNLEYDKESFIPGVSNSIDWSIDKIDSKLDAKAVINFTDRAGNETNFAIDLISTNIQFNDIFYNFGYFNPNEESEFHNFILTNSSNKEVIIDSIFLKSNKELNKTNGFVIDDNIFKQLPNLMLPIGGQLLVKIKFDSKLVKEEIEKGISEFKDEIGILAEKDSENSKYCFKEYLTSLIANVVPNNVKDNSNVTLIVSPNPSKDYISIDISTIQSQLNYDICEINIFNILNEKVLTQKYNSVLKQTINISNLPKGIYYIKIGNFTTKFIKL